MAKPLITFFNSMSRGFIQIPLLIAIIAVVVLGGSAYVAYEITSPSQPTALSEAVAESQATTTNDSLKVETADAGTEDSDSLIESLKKQVTDLTQKVNQPKAEIPKSSIITLPSGAVVEVDSNGNVIRTITTAPQQPYTAPMPSTQTSPVQTSPNSDTPNTQPPAVAPMAPKISQVLFSPNSSHLVIISDKQISALRFQKGQWAASATAPQNTTCRVGDASPIECVIYEPEIYLSVSVTSPITPHHLYSDGNINYQLELNPGLDTFLDSSGDLYFKVGVISVDGSVYTTNQFESHASSPRPIASFTTSQP